MLCCHARPLPSASDTAGCGSAECDPISAAGGAGLSPDDGSGALAIAGSTEAPGVSDAAAAGAGRDV